MRFLRFGINANAIDAIPVTPSKPIRIGSSEVCPQMLNGEERPAWLAIVLS